VVVGTVVLLAAAVLLAVLVAFGSPRSARSARVAGGLTQVQFGRLATARCMATRAVLGPDAIRNGGSPGTRSALAKEWAVTRAERNDLARLVVRTHASGLERVQLHRFVKVEGRVVVTLGRAVRTADLAQAGSLVRVAYARFTQAARELGAAACGLD
jgi:hypothetical protein